MVIKEYAPILSTGGQMVAYIGGDYQEHFEWGIAHFLKKAAFYHKSIILTSYE
ncbi:MAG: hypothetical protein R2865_12465 [Deinococcales bacterium]